MTTHLRPLGVPLTVDEHGTIRITGSRVTLDVIVACFKRGESPERILRGFPSLTPRQVYGAIDYYLQHTDAVEEYLRRQEAEAEAIRQKIERYYPTSELRAWIRERHARMQAPQ
jgi:uncharacterized protein (DUF433 family)